MPDPNARRDKALESIARDLATIAREQHIQTGLLERIEKSSRRTKFMNHDAAKPLTPPDPFSDPQEPTEGPQTPSDAGSANAEKPESTPFPQSDHPYFKRSEPDAGGR